MKNTINQYVILDSTNKVFWVSNRNFGYGAGNAVFETQFTESLTDATLMTKKEVDEVLERFNQFDFVLVGKMKVDAKALIICKFFDQGSLCMN